MADTTNILIAGVGGQGTLLASRILGHVLLAQGFDVKVSEIHGMSQRGGSVVTYVKFGNKVYSPVIDKGEADYIVSFELLESARWLPYLRIGGRLITNTQQIDPMPVIIGAAEYPKDLANKMETLDISINAVDALALAQKAGSIKAVNVVLIGVLSTFFTYPQKEWLDAIEALLPQKIREMNKEAFCLGAALNKVDKIS